VSKPFSDIPAPTVRPGELLRQAALQEEALQRPLHHVSAVAPRRAQLQAHLQAAREWMGHRVNQTKSGVVGSCRWDGMRVLGASGDEAVDHVGPRVRRLLASQDRKAPDHGAIQTRVPRPMASGHVWPMMPSRDSNLPP
jgi:hypothetical protein